MIRSALLAALMLAAAGAHAACPVPDATDPAKFRAWRDTLKSAEARTPLVECLQREIKATRDPAQGARLRLTAATLLQDSGQSAAARTMLEPALRVFARAGSERALAVAEYLLGIIDDDLGDYASADEHLRRAHLLFLSDAVSLPVEAGHTLSMLGTVAYERGDYDKAQRYFGAALDAAFEANDDTLRARVRGGIANLAFYRSDYREAIGHYEIAARLLTKIHGETSLPVARTYNNLGSCYFELGMYTEAQRWHERSLTIKTQLYGADSPLVASTVANLAEVLRERGQKSEARSMYERAHSIFLRAQGERNANVASVENDLGALELESGNIERARELLEHAVALRETTAGPHANDVAKSLNELGAAYQALGRMDDARAALERALLIASASDVDDLRAVSQIAYARFLASQQQFAPAVLFGKSAVNILQQMRNDVASLGHPIERSFLASREPTYRSAADWLITLGRLPEASQVLDMLKEEEYVDFIRTRALRDDLGATRAQFTVQETKFADEIVSAAGAFRQTQSAENKTKFQTLLRRINTELGGNQGTREAATAPALLSEEGVALVRYVVLPDRIRIVANSRKREWQRDTAIAAATLNRQIFELREELQNRRSDPRAHARELYRLLIEPIEADLRAERIQRLLIVEDGTLRYLPFATLFDGKRWLIESYELQVATPAAGKTPISAPRELNRVAAFGVTKGAPGLAALSGVATELDRIVKANDADRQGVVPGFVALDDAFNATRLQAALADGFPAIHIATHFVFRPGPVADSWMLLGDGARLTLADLHSSSYPLRNVELLTLSACETAVGQPDATGREFESFGVLAQRQGARAVLATLWSVSDLSTSVFMARLYREHQKAGDSATGTASALRNAQLFFLNDRAASPWRHPFYWAPYVVMSAYTPPGVKR